MVRGYLAGLYSAVLGRRARRATFADILPGNEIPLMENLIDDRDEEEPEHQPGWYERDGPHGDLDAELERVDVPQEQVMRDPFRADEVPPMEDPVDDTDEEDEPVNQPGR